MDFLDYLDLYLDFLDFDGFLDYLDLYLNFLDFDGLFGLSGPIFGL